MPDLEGTICVSCAQNLVIDIVYSKFIESFKIHMKHFGAVRTSHAVRNMSSGPQTSYGQNVSYSISRFSFCEKKKIGKKFYLNIAKEKPNEIKKRKSDLSKRYTSLIKGFSFKHIFPILMSSLG